MRACPSFRIAVLSVSSVLFSPIHAQSVTIFNDTFADGERRTQGLPASAAWFQNGAVATNLAVNNGALQLVGANTSRTLWTYFPAVDLKVGESITLSLDFSFSTPPTSGLRIALCYTNGTAPRLTDGPGPTGGYQGYGMENLLLIKRSGPAASNADSQLVNQLTFSDGQPVWTAAPATNRGVRGNPLQANTPYTYTLSVARVGPSSTAITETLTGAGFTGTNTVVVFDTSNIFTTFDTVGIGMVANTLAGDMLIARANLTTTVVPSTAGRLVNMSIRTNAGTGDNTLIVGVGVGGAGTSGAKPAVFRGVGPTLAAFGVGGTLADPMITAFQGATQIAQNDDWGGGFDFSTVGAFNLSGLAPRDAALYSASVPIGSYSLQITGKNDGTGIALAEIYDATPSALFTSTTPRLVNVSARTQVGIGDNILIAGFVIGGTTPVRVLIRAVGPTLGGFGVTGALADPKLEVFSGTGKVAENDNWLAGDAPMFTSVGAFALNAGSRDAALVTTLQPGSYTAQVSGVGNTTGIALVEVYELP